MSHRWQSRFVVCGSSSVVLPESRNLSRVHFLSTTSPTRLHPHIWVVNWCIKIRADIFFALSNNFSFLYLSLYTTFESETWQFTETFEVDFGKNSSGFL
jgi:hypothetical protein